MMVENRAPIRDALDQTIVVEAAAGTGKTTELVARIVRLIETGTARIGEIVAVTFGEKAAGELKLRIREELERARLGASAASAEAERLNRAVYDFEDAHVSTIHGFCAELLRERPVEACVDPLFTVLTDTQSEALFDEAFTGWLQYQLGNPGEGVRRSLRRPVPWHKDEGENGPIERLRRAARELREWRDHHAPWTMPAYQRESMIALLIDQLRAFAEVTARPLKRGDNFADDTKTARRISAEIERSRRIGAVDLDGWEASLIALADERGYNSFGAPRKGSGAAFAAGVSRADVHAMHATLQESLKRFRELANAEIAALLREEMRDCLARYEERKQTAGALDFLDLLIKARDLLRDCAEVRARFQERFRIVLVDEFQDTDPLQAELLLLLASDQSGGVRPGSLFIVGDPKQSIYRFRRADVGVYRRISEQLQSQGASSVTLQTSYRGVPAIQKLINAAFAGEMTGDARSLQASYVPLAGSRGDQPSQPAIVALPIPRPYGLRQVTLDNLQRSQPAAVAEFVRWLVSADCPWSVDAADRHDPSRRTRKKIVPGDVCLLFRRFLHYGNDVTRDYVEALEARGVPHLLVGGKTFHEREEVDAVRTALTAIEWPEDELSVYATLRGPLFALGEEELLEYRGRAGLFHPYRIAGDLPQRLRPVAATLQALKEFHGARNFRPVADTIGRLIELTRAHAGFVLWRGGEQVLANVLHISDLARRYEAEGGLSFRGFVEILREAADRAQAPEAPILEEGSEGVRLMTVHKAKGLEFPVVILADIGCRLSQREASRYLASDRDLCAMQLGGWSPVDLLDHRDEEAARDQAEGVRLAYVAATRARDLLVVPAVGDGPFNEGWLRPLNTALYPPIDQRQSPIAAAGVPVFRGKDTVLIRPDGQMPDASTVRPGTYEITDTATGAHFNVVWWDPLLLDTHAEDPRGLRRDDLIARDAHPQEVAADRARYERWRANKADLQQRAAKPSLAIVTATEWIKEGGGVGSGAHGDASAVVIEDAAVVGPRPSGRRFGVLVHGLLAAVPLDASASAIHELAVLHARVLGAPDDERDAAAAVVERTLRHPVIERARAAVAAGRSCRREAPISIMRDGTLIDGQLDLAFETAEGWTVVDFKTDAELGAAEEAYRRQIGLYADALSTLTGQPARAIILRV
ncbi:MAG TPA: UvrD-helicase domain-containing protein [Vicinamibacterales bacterium]|nr:UvrD-helicase domain-containing protein [Vicinamibacterales bacterium]